MVRYAPLVGLVLASPVVLQALAGDRAVEEALAAWLVAMLVAAAGLWLLGQTLRPGPVHAGRAPVDGDRPGAGRRGGSRRRRDDTGQR